MSIVLHNVRVVGEAADRPLFDGLSLQIGDSSRVAVLGTSKPETGALLRLICGTKKPDEGVVESDVRASWPIPLSGFLVPGQPLARNIRFIARLYGVDDDNFPRRIVEMVELGEFLNTPLAKCPKYAKGRLAFALGVGLDFDMYLFDSSLAPTDKPFKEKAAEITAARTAGRGVVVATGVPAEVEGNCESVYVLEQGRATYFAEASKGVEHFKQLLATEKKQAKVGGRKAGEGDEEESALSDVDMLGAAVEDALD